MSAPKTILVATDFSDPADRALDYALELAEKLGASVTVMHAYDIRPLDFLDGALVASADVPGQIVKAARAGLEATVAQRTRATVQVSTLLRAGEPRDQIHAAADEVGADLIVLGTHGHRGISRVLLGSVAEYVVRTATRPVLTVHAPRAHA